MIRRALILLLGGALAASTAAAHTRPPVKVSFTGLTVARPGVPITAQATIRAAQPVTIKQMEFGMRGTTVTNDAPLDSLVLPADTPHTVNLSVVPSTDDQLEFSFVAQGHKYVFKRDLSQFWRDLRNYGQTVGFDPQPDPPLLEEAMARRLPALVEKAEPVVSPWGQPVGSLDGEVRRAELMGAQANLTHTLNIRLRYTRPDNTKDDVDGAGYVLWLDLPGIDVPLQAGVTDHRGRISYTGIIPSSLGRSFYVSFVTENSWVHVLNNNDDDDPYRFKSQNFQGLSAGGTVNVNLTANHNGPATPALNMLTTVTRGYRFVLENTNYQDGSDIDDIDVSWPESDWPHYMWPFYETLYIPNSSRWNWNSGTFLHELGHHVNYELPIEMLEQDYSDGNCEEEGDDGRHCAWCGEDDNNVAVAEGFANYFADMVHDRYVADYGVNPYESRSAELIGTHDESKPCNNLYEPELAEGYFWALLRDLTDSENERDPGYDNPHLNLPTLRTAPEDQIELGFAAVVDILADYTINNYEDFRAAFLDRYSGSIPASKIWNTFANAGYWYDATRPSIPLNVRSTSHTSGVASPDNTITATCDAASDGQSGIQEYRFWLKTTAGNYVGSKSTGSASVRTVTFDAEAAGNYIIECDVVDNAGNISLVRGISPTYTIRNPTPVDLEKRFPAGWDHEIVARSTTGATTSNAQLTAWLPGDMDSTWLNWSVENTGESDVTSRFRTRVLIDGVVVDSVLSSNNLLGNPFNSHTVVNRGPYNLRPGRHTIEMWTDAEEDEAEGDETNNRWGRQFVWDPRVNTARGADHLEPAPPLRDGGAHVISVPIGQPRPYNCVAHRFTHNSNFFPITTTRWIATEMWPERDSTRRDDPRYLLMLDLRDQDPEYGFVNGLTTSDRGARRTNAVITNAVTSGSVSWEVGVQNVSGHNAPYHLRVNTAGTIGVGDSVSVTLEQNQMVAIRSLDVASGETGKLVVQALRVSGTSRVFVSYLGSTVTYSSLSGALGDISTNELGQATLSFTASAAGQYALLVWRDPADGTGPVTVTLDITQKPADLAIVTPSGWDAPVIPRPSNDALVNNALRPAILYGDDKPTWLSISKRNNSDVASGFNFHQVRVDDAQVFGANFASLAGLTTYANPNMASVTIPGGRHVLTQLLDPSNLHIELSEINNTYGEQYVWTPDTASSDAARWRRGQIGGPGAAWEYCDPATPLYFNMDGVRLPTWASGTDFAAVAVTPRDTSDVDLGLYLTQNDAKNGFEVPQEDSNWGPGQTDLLLLNFTLAQRKAYDIGIMRASDDTSSYLVDIVPGVVRNPSQAIHGPFVLAAHRLVQVHQFALPVGRHVFHLRNLAGTVDWAMAVYDAERPFQDRTQGEERGMSFANGPGLDEEVVIVAEQPMTIALVVHKTGSGETTKSGTYQIELNTDPTDAQSSGPVRVTRLAGAFPNPARDASGIHFDLARPDHVVLEVYDLRGGRVRSLVEGRLEPGRHRADWDGRDAAGHRVAPGVYLARLRTVDHEGQVKLIRVE